jgi:subtilisin family serine protease
MRHEKLSSGLISALGSLERRGVRALAKRTRALGIAHTEPNQKEPLAIVFIRTDEQASLEGMRLVRINQRRGQVRTAAVPFSAIEELAEHPAVHRITMSRYLRPCLDVALPRIHVPQFRSRNGADGSGVVVGVVDTGIDTSHPAFQGRVNRIWDQTIAGPGVPEGSYGLELQGAALTASRDVNGHGTHVAGIAAGADTTFSGVAPAATIIGVKTDFQNAHIADGVRYVFRVATDLNLPAVVNLSLGGQIDAHDGLDDLSEVIDGASGAGRIVCCAAGNEGTDNIHAEAHVSQGQTSTIRFQVPAGATMAILDGWYSGADEIEVAIQPPGDTLTPFQGSIAAGSPLRTYTSGNATINVTTAGPDPFNNDHQIYIEIESSNGQVTPGVWSLLLHGQAVQAGDVHFWSSDAEGGSSIPFLAGISDSMKIGSPGSSAKAITVASFTTKNTWNDESGVPEQVSLPVGALSSFSSPGPLRNGAQKPDIAAPGAMIVSALSADSQVTPAFKVTANFRVDAGTSMATPVITGVVALMLQAERTLTPELAKAALQQASTIPGQAAGTFDIHWGHGLLDANGIN